MIDASRLRVSEIVGISYLLYLSAAALVVRLPAARRIAVWLAAAFVLVIDFGAAARPVVWWGWSLRDWLPALVILIAYFATGALYVAPSQRFEAWLKEWDVRILGRRTFDALPTPLRVYFDIVYDFCFLLMPAGFATLVWLGHAASADRFWTIVSFAEFLPFGTLPWLQARPPWAIEARRDADRSGVRRFSLEWVEAVTIRANTFPSGHASGSLAVALALAQPAPRAAVAFGVVAVSIAIASVVGRFHYAIDAITGLLLAIVIWYLSPFLGI